jgi:hypothetical protein
VELPSSVLKPLAPIRKKTTHRLIEKTVMDMGGDTLLEGILSRLPRSYTYVSGDMSDEDVLYEVLKGKYGP